MTRFTTLYSGSSGNCGLLQCGSAYLLVDMGKSCRITLAALKELDLPLRDCAGILITHEHSDHVSGLATFLKKYPNIPVYGGADTLDMLESRGTLPPAAEAIALQGRTEDVGPFTVRAFPTSHDVPCCGYRIHTPEGTEMAIATDLGVLTPVVEQNLSGCDLVALEANYDLDRLRFGPYPYYLKQRIQSERGHLDNRDSAGKVAELVAEGCRRIALCHLSQENNTPELALSAVSRALREAGVTLPEQAVIQAQERHTPSAWLEF